MKSTDVQISTSPAILGNNVLSPAFLQSLDWGQLYKVAEPLVAKISDKKLHEKLLDTFPLKEGQEYVGSLCNHYRGRLRHEGKFALIDQMCSNSIRRLIVALSYDHLYFKGNGKMVKIPVAGSTIYDFIRACELCEIKLEMTDYAVSLLK